MWGSVRRILHFRVQGDLYRVKRVCVDRTRQHLENEKATRAGPVYLYSRAVETPPVVPEAATTPSSSARQVAMSHDAVSFRVD
jgi:hypothetical protein